MHLFRFDANDFSRDEVEPRIVPVRDRIRRLPEAVLLTTGYYASKSSLIGGLVRRTR